MSAVSDTEGFVELALVAVGVYLVYQLVKSAPSATAAAASAVADAACGITGACTPAQPGQTYQVTMADGSVQTVPYGQLPNPAGAGITGTASDTIADAYGNDF